MTDKELFQKYLDKLESIKDPRYDLLRDDFEGGQYSYLRMKFKGSSIFNPIWIDKIEDCIYELDQITNNPREVTTEEGSVIPVELAKKISYESVQHLASHSQYIKEVSESGDVIPAKILGFYSKEELHTYENRFIATFIRRLTLFIDKRYEFIKKTIRLDEKEIMYVKNKSMVDGQEVEVETKITVTRALEDDLSIAARDYIARIAKLKEYVGYYYNSPFMKEFKTEKNVRKPIVLTNIIRKNPLYHKCYETFLFIERFDSLGVSFKVDRDFQEFNEKERESLSHILLSNLLFLENTENSPVYQKSNKVYKPKLLTSIDDECFVYDDLVKGPVEYVRADETYLKARQAMMPKDLPAHPNKSEKLYYKKEYELKAEIAREADDLEALLNRIRHRIERYERKVERLIAERNEEEAKLVQEYLAELRKAEQDVLDRIREQIIAAAKRHKEELKAEEARKKAEEEARKKAEAEAKALEEAKVQEEANVEEVPVEETPIEEAPAEEVQTEENPAEEVPSEEPVEEAPVETAPAEDMVVETITDEPAEESVGLPENPTEVAPIEENEAAEDAQTDEPQEEQQIEEVSEETAEEVEEAPAEEANNAQEEQPEEEVEPIVVDEDMPVYYIVEDIKYEDLVEEEKKGK